MPDAPIVWTPGALKSRARRVHAAVTDLGMAVRACDGQDVDPGVYAAWREWAASWVAYWSGWTDLPLGSGWWGATASTLETFEADLEGWRRRWGAVCGRQAVPPGLAAIETYSPGSGLKWGIAAGVAATIALLYATRR